MQPRWILGLVSDTHGYFDPALPRALKGVDRILHAGDVGSDTVLESLAGIAPVTAIRGNVDTGSRHPETCIVLWGGLRIRLVHSIEEFAGNITRTPVEIVVCGHSHRPYLDSRDGALFVNPGAAGRKRFSLPRTCARLWLVDREVQVEFVNLDTGKPFKLKPHS